MRAPAAHRVAVTALGHSCRGDDAVGILVAEALRGLLPQDVPVLFDSGDALSLLDLWSDCDVLVCVDACASMGNPGQVHRLDLSTDPLPPQGGGTSSHGFGLAEAIALARTLQLTPRKIIVYAIEGRCFDPGVKPTAEVAAAVAPLARGIAREVARLRQAI